MNEEKITTINSLDVESQIGESETLLDQMKTMVRQNKLAAFAAVVIIVIALAAIFAPLAAPYDPYAQTLTDRLQAPSAAHLLGTDELGRDLFSRIIYIRGKGVPAGGACPHADFHGNRNRPGASGRLLRRKG